MRQWREPKKEHNHCNSFSRSKQKFAQSCLPSAKLQAAQIEKCTQSISVLIKLYFDRLTVTYLHLINSDTPKHISPYLLLHLNLILFISQKRIRGFLPNSLLFLALRKSAKLLIGNSINLSFQQEILSWFASFFEKIKADSNIKTKLQLSKSSSRLLKNRLYFETHNCWDLVSDSCLFLMFFITNVTHVSNMAMLHLPNTSIWSARLNLVEPNPEWMCSAHDWKLYVTSKLTCVVLYKRTARLFFLVLNLPIMNELFNLQCRKWVFVKIRFAWRNFTEQI